MIKPALTCSFLVTLHFYPESRKLILQGFCNLHSLFTKSSNMFLLKVVSIPAQFKRMMGFWLDRLLKLWRLWKRMSFLMSNRAFDSNWKSARNWTSVPTFPCSPIPSEIGLKVISSFIADGHIELPQVLSCSLTTLYEALSEVHSDQDEFLIVPNWESLLGVLSTT